MTTPHHVPVPNLQIIPVSHICPHEEHDSQRSKPLIRRLRHTARFTNPPIVAPMGDGRFVILDGANRYHSVKQLGFAHVLVQVVPYDSGLVELLVWQHIISEWSEEAFLAALAQLPALQRGDTNDSNAIAIVTCKHTPPFALMPNEDTRSTNALLRAFVNVYQRQAHLERTSIENVEELWQLYPKAIALVKFKPYTPAQIIHAAQSNDYLPPGVSRHIIQGRALKLNFPMEKLRDNALSLEDKNAFLRSWLQEKFSLRNVRLYTESTYQFDE